MDHKQQEQIALHRWAVIAEAAGQQLTAAERGALVRQIAARAHTHPDGSSRRYSRGTIDRWLRAWRKGGLEALQALAAGRHRGGARAPGAVRRGRRAAAGAARPLGRADRLDLVSTGTGSRSPSGPSAASCAAPGCTARRWPPSRRPTAGTRPPGRTSGGSPTCWSARGCPGPRREGSVRARLFLIVDDHSRLLVDGRFFAHENARACQDLLRRAITRRGLPEVFYC